MAEATGWDGKSTMKWFGGRCKKVQVLYKGADIRE